MTNTTNTPTVVLAHGGFADASFWGSRHPRAAGQRPPRRRSPKPAARPRARRRVFPKLGITARGELAAALAADGAGRER